MSKTWDHSLREWEDFSILLRSMTLRHQLGTLSCTDQIKCQDAVLSWAMVVTDLTDQRPVGSPVHPGSRKDFLQRLVRCLEFHCLDELIDWLKAVDEFILSASFRDSECPKIAFKQQIFGLRHGFDWLAAYFNRYVRWEPSTFVGDFRFIHQCCAFMTRLNLDLPCLSATALTDWIARQDNLPSGLRLDGLIGIVRSWFHDFTLTDPYPRNGNGSVYLDKEHRTTTCSFEKYQFSSWSPLMRHVDVQFFGGALRHPFGYEDSVERCSKLQFVPKSYNKVRSIAMEPPGKMWYQQAGLRMLDEYFSHHLYLRRRINLHDASRNTELARLGSIDGSYTTIDLSAASDCVTWDLVKRCFQHTRLYPLILAARTRKTLFPDGTLYELKAHATMGSALCFPIECVVFAAICEEVIICQGCDPHKSRYVVYGDDIVVETQFAPALVRALEYFGFKINLDKSYYDLSRHKFRESCGGEFLDGADVTPLRISRRFVGYPHEKCTSAQYSACVELANDCFIRLPVLRSYVVRKLLKLPRHLQPLFCQEGGGYLYSDQSTNFHLFRHRGRSRDYQRTVYVCGSVMTRRPDEPEAQETIRLYEWFVLSRSERMGVLPDPSYGQLPVVATVAKKQGSILTSIKV